MQQRTTAEVMRLRGSTVEHPFATIKYRIFGHPRFLLRGTGGAQTEINGNDGLQPETDVEDPQWNPAPIGAGLLD